MILDIIIIASLLMFLLPLLSGMALVFRVRRHLQNPFERRPDDPSAHVPGDVIQGEYKVLDETDKK